MKWLLCGGETGVVIRCKQGTEGNSSYTRLLLQVHK